LWRLRGRGKKKKVKTDNQSVLTLLAGGHA
jgi:hypothetical protein